MRKIYILITFIFIGLIGHSQTDSTATTAVDSTGEESNIVPAFTIDADALETEASTQDVSGLLTSSRDVYTSTAGFNFGAARYRIRGFGSENYDFMMNGIKVNDPYTNWAVFRYWGGLNDVTRYPEVTNGLGATQWSFGGVGGTSNKSLRASDVRKTKKLSYALSNRSYSHRTILTYATGMMDNGWAVAFTGSARYADEGYRPGTIYSAGGYFLSVEKKLNKKHSIGFVGFGAPTVQGKAGIAIQEVYDLTDNPYYNPYTGYQTNAETGKRELRNSRVRNTHVPHFMLSDYFNISDKTKLATTGYFIAGKTKNSRLDWSSGSDPRPDYYKYLPSYWLGRNDAAEAAKYQNSWNSEDGRSIDWDQLYFVNEKNLFTANDANGEQGNSETGLRAVYSISDDVIETMHYGAKTNLTHQLNDKLFYSGGLTYANYTGTFYREMKDLLGADWWLDINRFAERDFADPAASQLNLDEQNRLIEVGDKFGYNYELHRKSYDLFSQVEFKTAKLDGYIGGNVAMTSIWRNGIWKNGIFLDDSQGESDKVNMLTYAVKGGATYKVTGRHFVTLNGVYQSRPPSLRNSFIQPQMNEYMPANFTTEKVFGGDFSYNIRMSKLKLRATAYYYQVKDQMWNRSFYHDDLATFINYSMSGVNHLYQGGELGFEFKPIESIKFKGAFGTAQFLYNSRPSAYVVSGNTNEALIDETTIYLENFHVGGTPETVGSLGLEYRSSKFWFVGADFNYFADMYLEANPDRRTEHALDKYITTDPQWEEMIGQTKLDNGYTVNAFAGKSWRINYKYYISLNINVSNVLNTQSFQTGGFEQLRYDQSEIGKFPNKASYMFGRTYFAMVSFRF